MQIGIVLSADNSAREPCAYRCATSLYVPCMLFIMFQQTIFISNILFIFSSSPFSIILIHILCVFCCLPKRCIKTEASVNNTLHSSHWRHQCFYVICYHRLFLCKRQHYSFMQHIPTLLSLLLEM